MKSNKIIAFSVVFLYSESLKNIQISDVKKVLNLTEEEGRKTALLEVGEAGIGLMAIDEDKKISLEVNRIVLANTRNDGVEINDLERILSPIYEMIKSFPLKAYGFNYDVIIVSG